MNTPEFEEACSHGIIGMNAGNKLALQLQREKITAQELFIKYEKGGELPLYEELWKVRHFMIKHKTFKRYETYCKNHNKSILRFADILLNIGMEALK